MEAGEVTMAPARAGDGLPPRRQFLALALAAAVASLAPASARAAARATTMRVLPPQLGWGPVPAQAPATEGMAPLPGLELYYWDTGGPGEPILLCHPATGSALVWGYQQPAFARAGFRVIGYSRRGHARSGSGPAGDAGFAVDDIDALLAHLKVDKFHMVASAAGGFCATDFALTNPGRLASMTISCSQAGVTEQSFRDQVTAFNPPWFRSLPASFRELGSYYRAGYPQGVAEWEQLEEHALSGAKIILQRTRNRIDFADLEKIEVPTLVVAGGADLVTPVALMQQVAGHLPRSETVVISDCGHSAYWEQPDVFNAAVLDFLGRHRAR
jgi:pimeloyl-ACP methyl ester carboxylesterase